MLSLTEFLASVVEPSYKPGHHFCSHYGKISLSIELSRQQNQGKPACKKVIKYGLAIGNPCRG